MEVQKSTDKEPCPFCGNVYEEEFAIGFRDDPADLFYVTCSCGAQGPFSTTKAGAVILWNRRKI